MQWFYYILVTDEIDNLKEKQQQKKKKTELNSHAL